MLTVSLLAALLAGIAGIQAGRRLAARGLTAKTALEGRQAVAWAILLLVAGMFALVYFAPKLSLLTWVPVRVGLLAEEAVWPVVFAMTALALGLIAALEWPGRREPRRVATALVGSAFLLTALVYLTWRSLPIGGLLGQSNVHDGVVLQTTAYTCAPATMATLARAIGLDTTMTESAAVSVSRTTREGTTTMRELKAMRALGLSPRFARHQTPDSLIAAGRPALLHVDEPVGATTIRHAVALLEVDSARRRLVIGNPLHGRQIVRFDQLPGYWTGEAIFVERGRGERVN